jgi:phosphoglycolate phosphatase-like HAD superfamily hydrolase
MIKAIIFDFDGVLVESTDSKTEAFRKLFSRWPDKADEGVGFHLKNMGISRYIKFKHFYENIIRERYSEEIGLKLGSEFSDIVLDEIKIAPFVKGAKTFLDNFHSKYSFYIASGTPDEELCEIVSFKRIHRYFDGIFGSSLTKTEIINNMLGTDSLKNNMVVFVGDAESDRKAAEDTGVHFVLRVTHENHDLRSSCRYEISDLTELEGRIKEIGK